MNLEGTVNIPFIKKKVSKKLLLFVGLAAITYYYLNKGSKTVDAAQLVIGAPGPGQISITNPDPVRRAAPRVAKPVTRLGGAPTVRTVARARCKPGYKLVRGKCVATNTIPRGSQFAPTAPVNPSQVPTPAKAVSQTSEFVHAVTHPGSGFSKDPEGHVDPEHIKATILENLKAGKIAGLP